MAQVDFSNARLIIPSLNPVKDSYVSIQGNPTNSSGVTIVTNATYRTTINEKYQFLMVYTGTFTASGTEFYIGSQNNVAYKWKITGVSFQTGDTYSFQIPVTLTCN